MMVRLDLTFSHFEEILKKGYNLDILFLLKLVEEQECNIQELCAESPKLSVLYQTILRKGLITDNCKLTLEGKAIIAFLSLPSDLKIERKKPSVDEFESWWKAYPGTDTFTHKGKDFTGTRGLRAKKDECKLKFNKILGEGEYTTAELIQALEFEVLQKKENSVKTDANKLSFMQNSLTYLNQRTFDPFIELIKEGHKIVETPQQLNSTDI
jgi:hypothetical protein